MGKGPFRRHSSNLRPRDQFSAARQLREVPKSVVSPPEPSLWHPRVAELYVNQLSALMKKIIQCSCDCVATSAVPRGHLPQLTLLMSNPTPGAASNPPPFAIHAPSTEGSAYGPSTPARTCHIAHV
eukprot:365403-Chlamydomonas_euryale.AAC.12